ncbi:MAG: ABC transporter permease, partial [Erysipelotrichaceae bacterium]
MKNMILKDTLKEIKKTFGRFFSILLIVLVGVSFFVGVSAGAPVMANSVDKYIDETNLMDLQIYSNYGIDDNDIQAIHNISGVLKVEGKKYVDVVAKLANKEQIVRINSYNEEHKINQFVLKEGNMPKNANEVVAELG